MDTSGLVVAEGGGLFGQVVAGHRERLGLTQEALAAVTGMSVRRISELESGRVSRPRKSTVRLLADAFGLSGVDRERFLRQASESSIRPITSRSSSTDHTAARSPNFLCWLRTGSPDAAPDCLAITSSALPRYCCDTIRGLPSTRADSTR